jgi:hypothetical protein
MRKEGRLLFKYSIALDLMVIRGFENKKAPELIILGAYGCIREMKLRLQNEPWLTDVAT